MYISMIDQAAIQAIARTAKEAVVIEWRRQGHELTGKAANTIEYEVEQKAGATNIRFYIQDYMANINQGIPANRIPYSPGSGAKFSKFIAGLTRYAKMRFGANQKDAEEALIAKKYAEGEDLLRQALKRAPNDYTGLVLMAKAKIMQENYRGSIPYLDLAMKVYPDEAQAPHLRGVVEKKLGNKTAAWNIFTLRHNARRTTP